MINLSAFSCRVLPLCQLATCAAVLSIVGCAGISSPNLGQVTGPVPPNVILYSVSSDYGATSSTIQVNPDGSGRTQLFHLPAYFQGVALNLAAAGEKIFGYAPNGGMSPTYGIYRNSAISTVGMVQIVKPSYSYIESIQVSSDGAWVYFIAAIGSGDAYLYKAPMKGGTPIVLDNSSFVYTANVDTVSGGRITYDKDYIYPDGTLESAVFIRSTASDGVPVLLVNDSGSNYGCPQFSPDGTKIEFVSDRANANMEVYVVSSSGGNILQVTDAPSISKQYTGVSFSPDSSSTAFIGLGEGVYRSGPIGSVTDPWLIVSDPTVMGGIYWTNSAGRAQAGSNAYISRRRHRGLTP